MMHNTLECGAVQWYSPRIMWQSAPDPYSLHCTALHCTALHCTALHYTELHYTTLHCSAFHQWGDLPARVSRQMATNTDFPGDSWFSRGFFSDLLEFLPWGVLGGFLPVSRKMWCFKKIINWVDNFYLTEEPFLGVLFREAIQKKVSFFWTLSKRRFLGPLVWLVRDVLQPFFKWKQ